MAENGRILIDDLEGQPAARQAPAPGPVPPGPAMPQIGEREDWLKRYNAPPTPVEFPGDDPYSPAYARFDLDETPGSILHYWLGYSADRTSTLEDRRRLWFNGGFELDRMIAHRFTGIVARLASGLAQRWAAQGPRERLAAVIALDQFSRNIFRNTPGAFENDPIAVKLTREAIASGEDMELKPVERWFLYMPLMHSESSTDQRRSLDKFSELATQAPPELKEALTSAYDFARRHANVIRKFGRFPHRNDILGRTTTSAEKNFLKQPGSRF